MHRRTLLCAASTMLLAPWSAGALASALTPGRAARAILVTGGDSLRYRRIFLNFIEGLRVMQLVDHVPADPEPAAAGTKGLWEAMSRASSPEDKIEFLPDGHYSYDFDPVKRLSALERVLDRLLEKKDVDIIFTFGTEASLDLKNRVLDIPILSLGSTDPIANGLIKSVEDSGQPNFHSIVITDYYSWQTEVFHSIIPFRKLGLPAVEWRIDKTGAKDIERSCSKLGIEFELAPYPENNGGGHKDYLALRTAIKKLVDNGCDALMLPWFPASAEDCQELVRYLEKRGVPSFSQAGVDFVSRGILLGVGEENLSGYGLFEADVVRQVLDGYSPGDIKQAFAERSRLVINLATAMHLGWRVPFSLLVSVEKAFVTQIGPATTAPQTGEEG